MKVNNQNSEWSVRISAKKAIASATALSVLLTAGIALADNKKNSTPADARGMISDVNSDNRKQIEQTAKEAAIVYRKMTSGSTAQISQSEIARAKCIAIFPNLTNVAVGVGGSHGDGIVTCRTANGLSNVAPVDLTSASIGIQLGASETDLILLFNSDKAQKRLEQGTLTLGADVSVSASNKEQKAVGAMVSTESSDVVGFARDRGLFAGAALSGTALMIDQDEVQNLYGKQIPAPTILSNRVESDLVSPVRELLETIAN